MTQQQLLEKIDVYLRENERAIVEDLAQLVAVRSVEEPAAEGAPYGPGPRKALEEALAIARRLGLATDDCDGRVGWAQLPGREAGHLATMTHLDVVPEGDGWDADPYVMREREGYVLGRGVCDDKGPSVLCLHMAAFFRQLGQPLRYGLRVLLGCNEESGMTDVDYYLERNEQPLFCFSPDANFPVCHGEKGVFGGAFVSAPLAGNLLDFSGGVAGNVIPNKAGCTIKADPALLKGTDRITVSGEKGAARLTAAGIGGHAAHPEGTVNAIGLLVDYLLENNLCTAGENAFLTLLQKLHHGTDGSGLGIACSDDKFTPLTCVGGVISFENGVLRQSIDIRYPMATSGQALGEALQAAAAAQGASFELRRNSEPFYIPAASPAIQTLMQAYRDVTGDDAPPFTMGGGTYARHFKNAVSFGPEKEGEPLPGFAGPIHGPNEGISIAALMEALKIYILAVWQLQNVDFPTE